MSTYAKVGKLQRFIIPICLPGRGRGGGPCVESPQQQCWGNLYWPRLDPLSPIQEAAQRVECQPRKSLGFNLSDLHSLFPFVTKLLRVHGREREKKTPANYTPSTASQPTTHTYEPARTPGGYGSAVTTARIAQSPCLLQSDPWGKARAALTCARHSQDLCLGRAGREATALCLGGGSWRRHARCGGRCGEDPVPLPGPAALPCQQRGSSPSLWKILCAGLPGASVSDAYFCPQPWAEAAQSTVPL